MKTELDVNWRWADGVTPEPGPRRSGPSGAQIRANRRNSAKSTGPKTESGKAQSARNALKHGAYSRTSLAIPRGAFAEDQAELDQFVDALIDSEFPEEGLEFLLVRRIASHQLQNQRQERLAACLAAAEAEDAEDPEFARCIAGAQDSLVLLAEAVEILGERKSDPDRTDFRSLVLFLADEMGLPYPQLVELELETEDDPEASRAEFWKLAEEHSLQGEPGVTWFMEKHQSAREELESGMRQQQKRAASALATSQARQRLEAERGATNRAFDRDVKLYLAVLKDRDTRSAD